MQLLRDLDVHIVSYTTLFCDSKSVTTIEHNPVLHEKTKHIDIDLYFIKDYIYKGVIKTYHVRTHKQVAGAMTKALGQFQHLVGKMGMLNIHSPS